MGVRLQQADLHELLAAIDALNQNGWQCGEGVLEVREADLKAVNRVVRRIKLNIGYISSAGSGRKQ